MVIACALIDTLLAVYPTPALSIIVTSMADPAAGAVPNVSVVPAIL